MRNGNEHVATVTEHIPAHALTDLDSLEVKGHISGGEGSLQLTWKQPNVTQAGEYSCEANGLTNLGHNVVLTENLEIGNKDPTMEDLIQHIAGNQQEISALRKEMADLSHVESGFIDCQGSETWSQRLANVYGGQDRYVAKTVTFAKAFSTAPVVHLSASHWWDHVDSTAETGITNGYYYIDLVDVTKENFTMRCRTFAPDHIHMSVSWLSVSQ